MSGQMLAVEWSLLGLLGLLVGSFLNVVVHRVPKMLEQEWAVEAQAILDQRAGKEPSIEATPAYNLFTPRSACPSCGHMITWLENVPILSWLWLRGKCSACKAPIGVRYPVVELVTGAWFAYCAWRFGWTGATAAWCAFGAILWASALIDWDTTLLPDQLTLPLLWLGLIAATLHLDGLPSLTDSVWGTVGGYLSLWSIYWAFKLLTGKEGMGYGDFKLFAALGAWFGWTALVPMMLMSSVIGALIGIVLKFTGGLREGRYVPFGPFLAGAGVVSALFGAPSILRAVGL